LAFGNLKIWRGCRWIGLGMKYGSEIDDPIKKAANTTSADNIAGSILYIINKIANDGTEERILA
jgi:hypothetical protein